MRSPSQLRSGNTVENTFRDCGFLAEFVQHRLKSCHWVQFSFLVKCPRCRKLRPSGSAGRFSMQASVCSACDVEASVPGALLFRMISPFSPVTNPFENVTPAFQEAPTVLFLNYPERLVMKLDQRATFGFTQSVLKVRNYRVRHEQRSADFQQRGTLDCLHMSPEMSIVASLIAEP